jgi:L-threonylcarbamoyladenylate synthase
VILVHQNDREAFIQHLSKLRNNGKLVGAITYSEDLNAIDKTKFHLILSLSVERYAQNIFHALRELDSLDVDYIIVERVEEKGIGAAVMDRLNKAAQDM